MPKTGPGVKRPKAKKRTSSGGGSDSSRRRAPPPEERPYDFDEDEDAEDDLQYMSRRHAPEPFDDDDDDDDDAEDFNEVMPLKGVGGDSEEEDEDEDDEEDEDEDEEDEDDEDEGYNASGLAKLSDEDDDDDDESDDDEPSGGAPLGSLGWGKSKKDLYGGHGAEGDSDGEEEDDMDEDERADALEAAEALRLQKAHAARLRPEDFADLSGGAASSKGKKKGKGGAVNGGVDDASLARQVDADLAELPAALRGATGVRVESVRRDLSGLSEAELQKAVEADAPELLQLLGEFKSTLAEARSTVGPLLSAAKARKLAPDGGVRLLSVKVQLLLSYASNLSFYLMLKAQGRSVRDHPVISALLRHRLLLERLRPLEQKGAYKLQKLLQLAAAADGDPSAVHGDLAERPNPGALLSRGGGGGRGRANGAAEDDEDDDEEGEGGVYRPPKLAAVPYEEGGDGRAKRERQQARALARASSSRLVRELREEMSDAPRAIHADDFGRSVDADSAAVARFRAAEEERRAYEEANFKRLRLTKDEKRAAKRREAAASGVAFDELNNFDDFSHLYETARRAKDGEGGDDPREERMKALRQYMNSIEQRGGTANRKKRSADEDAPVRTREERSQEHARKAASRAQSGEDGGGDDNGGGSAEEDAFYTEALNASKQKKSKRAERRAVEAEAAREAVRSTPRDEADAEEARAAGRQIEKNRGLTRERKKIDANPRVKNREKFRKAAIRRKGQVRSAVTPGAGAYEGELTGIKKNVSHSTRF